MLISTNADAHYALLQLSNDLVATATDLGNAAAGVDMQNQLPCAAGVAAGAINSGSTDLIGQEIDLLTGLEQDTQSLYGQFDLSDTPITADQAQQLKSLQQLVIDARAVCNSTISAVQWTFGDLAGDAVTSVVNTASGIVGDIASGLGTTYRYVQIGLAVGAALLVLYFGYRVSR